MRFLHLGDLHIGKNINEYNIDDIQEDLLQQVVKYSDDNNIQTLVLAGDIYDRSLPREQSVRLLNNFLKTLIVVKHKKVLMIAGNHDSAERLNFLSDLLENQGLYIVGFPKEKITPINIEGVNFYLIPYITPSDIRGLFPQESELNTYEQAYKYYLDYQDIDFNKTNVLVAHQFFGPPQSMERNESEGLVRVGGSDNIDGAVIQDFDYACLGHLHSGQKVIKDTIRYSGSMMKYAFGDNGAKGMVDVEINDKEVSYKQVELHPKKDLVKIKGSFKDLLEGIGDNNNFVAIELEDKEIVINARSQLETKYPFILQINYPNINHKISSESKTKANEGFEKKSMEEVFEEFYEKMVNEEIDSKTKEVIKEMIEESENHVA